MVSGAAASELEIAGFPDLDGQVIVVTGGASGMGRAVAPAASREGARLAGESFNVDVGALME